MSRVDDLDPASLTPEQKEVAARIAGTRGGVVRGPFAIWLRNPAIAAAADRLGTTLRQGKLDKRLFELMVLLVARHHSAQYEWYAHARHAAEVGLAPAVVEAIRVRRKPEFAREDERLIYDLVTEMNETRMLSQATYDRAVAAFGLDCMIELITALGFYTLVAIMLNASDAPVPGGERPLS
ncbi:MAG TPA: carboxymuconolactone decarboxylase family protein [Alphaproteobacteria bacterium]|nr:carboxymuconolactone decarboxylase family protein [Alphaproteobacteria bacterium]